MKLALVGVGGINVSQHTPALMKYAREVAPLTFAICDPSPERRAEWRGQFGQAEEFASVDELLKSERPDAAVVCVPEKRTCEVVLQFLKVRIPVLTEKPPGNSAAEVIRLRDAASVPSPIKDEGNGPRASRPHSENAGSQAAGTAAVHMPRASGSQSAAAHAPHAVAFNRRWSPFVLKLKELAGDPALSKPTCCTCTFTRSKRYDADFAATAIHGLDALRFLGGDVASLTVSVSEQQGAQPYRNFLLTGQFVSGAQLQMTVLPVSGRAVERYAVIAEDVTLEACTYMPGVTESAALRVFRGKRQEAMWDEASLGVAEAHESVRCGFYRQAVQFLDGLRNGGPLGVSFGDALQSIQLMEFLRNARDGDTWTP